MYKKTDICGSKITSTGWCVYREYIEREISFRRAIEAMDCQGCDEVVLETEITNLPALRLYERLGFVRDERLFQYYLNGVDAFRLKLWLR